MNRETREETAKDACTKTRRHIDRLIRMLGKELDDRGMRGNETWATAGSLGHVRDLLGEAVGFLKGVEGSEIIDAMINKNR